MKSYELVDAINITTVKDLEKSADFIPKDELKKIHKALIIKKMLTESGYDISHYKKNSKVLAEQEDFNYVFRVEKSTYKLGDSSQTFYDCVFRVWNWLLRSGEVRGELI